MKTIKWIIIVVISMNLLIVMISFAFPGKLRFVDNYQISIQKKLIHHMDKTSSRHFFQAKRSATFIENTILYPELTQYLDSIQPGSIFFSIHGRSVSKIFIRSDWKHCGIYLGSLKQIQQYWGANHEFVESLKPFYENDDEYLIFDSSYDQGVSIHSILDMAGLREISTLRKLLIFEFTYEKEEWSRILYSNLSHLGKKYDYCFVLNDDDALYCSEFLYEILPLKKNYFNASAKIMGRDLLLPSDLVDSISDKGISSGAFIHKTCISKEGKSIQIHPL